MAPIQAGPVDRRTCYAKIPMSCFAATRGMGPTPQVPRQRPSRPFNSDNGLLF